MAKLHVNQKLGNIKGSLLQSSLNIYSLLLFKKQNIHHHSEKVVVVVSHYLGDAEMYKSEDANLTICAPNNPTRG